MYGYIMFTDIKGFSKLSEDRLEVVYEKVYPELYIQIKDYVSQAETVNTWGDALFTIFADVEPAVKLSLSYRKFFKQFDFSKYELIPLQPRIACHAGEFKIFEDKILKRSNVIGGEVNCAARIEPVTRPGEIFVTDVFKEQVERNSNLKKSVDFSILGDVQLAKDWGDKKIFRMVESEARDRQTIDRLIRLNLKNYLPSPRPLSKEESTMLNTYKNVGSIDSLEALLSGKMFQNYSAAFHIDLAKICNNYGLYDLALEYLNIAKSTTIDVDGIKIHPHSRDTALDKLYANCLTRIGKYDDAADIMYGLFQSGNHESDTLAMLAAQYKRRALIKSTGGYVQQSEINWDLLRRAQALYIEAFRRDISALYPLLNATYLMAITKDRDFGYATFANYIIEAFTPTSRNLYENWWHAAGIAEAELLNKESTKAKGLFIEAIQQFNPDNFQLEATRKQIELYSYFLDCQDETKEILAILKN